MTGVTRPRPDALRPFRTSRWTGSFQELAPGSRTGPDVPVSRHAVGADGPLPPGAARGRNTGSRPAPGHATSSVRYAFPRGRTTAFTPQDRSPRQLAGSIRARA